MEHTLDPNRVPPHSEAAELSVLGTVMLYASDALPLVGELQVDDFFFPCHREAWAAIKSVVERRMPVDVISVGDEIKTLGLDARFKEGWQAWSVQAAASVTVWQNVGGHADVIRKASTLRKLINLAVEIHGAAYGNQPADEVLARAREGVAALEVSGGVTGPEKLESLLGPALDAIDARQRKIVSPGVMTGISELDRKLTGLKPGRLYILGGRPGDGKTALANCIALHAARAGIPVLFFSREMANSELVERGLSLTSKIPAFKIGGGDLDLAAWKKIQAAAGDLVPARLWFDDRSTTIERIVAESRKWHATQVKAGLGLIVLDYLQLARLTKVRAGANREQVVAEMSRSLKELGGELKVPMLVLSQLNRGAEERGGRPIPSDLRESGALEQDADVILFVYRDIPPENQEDRRKSGPAEIVIGKHRGGPTAIVNVHLNTELMQFTGLESENDEQQPDTRANWQDGDER
jgi:replicative DNA helicase